MSYSSNAFLFNHLYKENPETKIHLENLGIGWRIILKFILIDRNDVDWIDLAEDRENWLSVVNAVMNLQVP
jgi:hypothetical protein